MSGLDIKVQRWIKVGGSNRWGDISPLLHSCLGARGRPKLLSSVVSSSSARLLPLLHSSSPFARVVVRAARTHLSSFGDGGLTCALLALWLASNPPPHVPLPLVGSLYECFAAQFLIILRNQVAFDVEFGDVRHLRCVVRTVLSSKPGCCLRDSEEEVVCSLLLRSFLEAVPSGVGVTSVVGLAPSHSRVVSGVVVPLGEGDEERLRWLDEGSPIRACLFECVEVEWPSEVASCNKGMAEEASLKHLASVVERAVEEDGVKIFFCQKVLHPRLKKRLHGARVMVLDRLGGEIAKRIQRILDVKEERGYGTTLLSRPHVECLGRSRFLVLSSPHLPSLLLTHHNQEALAELEVVCRQSLSALSRLLVRSPRVCFGGGCSEITAALILAKKVCVDSICSETSCTRGQVLCSLGSFVRGVAHLCSSIHQGALANFVTDSESGHLWQQPVDKCACGSRDASSVTAWRQLTDITHHPSSTESPSSLGPSCPQTSLSQKVPSSSFSPDTGQVLLDELDCKLSSLSLAFETSSMLLKTTECIHTSPLAEQTKLTS